MHRGLRPRRRRSTTRRLPASFLQQLEKKEALGLGRRAPLAPSSGAATSVGYFGRNFIADRKNWRQVFTATTAIENRKRRHNFPQIEWLIGEMVGKGSLPPWGLLGVLRKQSMRITSKDPGTGGILTFRLNVVDHPPDREDVYLSSR
jgi:hypothetical protein